MSWFREMQASGRVKFVLTHAIISAAVAVYVTVHYVRGHEPPFIPFVLNFSDVFLGSLAGSLLALAQMVEHLLKGGTNGVITIAGHGVPSVNVAGTCAVVAIVCQAAGLATYRSKLRYFLFIVGSVLFIASAYLYFTDVASGRPLWGLAAIMQEER